MRICRGFVKHAFFAARDQLLQRIDPWPSERPVRLERSFFGILLLRALSPNREASHGETVLFRCHARGKYKLWTFATVTVDSFMDGSRTKPHEIGMGQRSHEVRTCSAWVGGFGYRQRKWLQRCVTAFELRIVNRSRWTPADFRQYHSAWADSRCSSAVAVSQNSQTGDMGTGFPLFCGQ
jgi:hypothetical protein